MNVQENHDLRAATWLSTGRDHTGAARLPGGGSGRYVVGELRVEMGQSAPPKAKSQERILRGGGAGPGPSTFLAAGL